MHVPKFWTEYSRAAVFGFDHNSGQFFRLSTKRLHNYQLEQSVPVLSRFTAQSRVRAVLMKFGLQAHVHCRQLGTTRVRRGLMTYDRHGVWAELFEVPDNKREQLEYFRNALGWLQVQPEVQPATVPDAEWAVVHDVIEHHRLHAPIVLHPNDLRSLTI